MSRDVGVIKRYAKALFEAAEAGALIGRVEEDLKQVSLVFEEQPDLLKLLDHPNLDVSHKASLLEQAFGGGKLSSLAYNTIRLLLDRGRQSLIPLLYEPFKRISDEARGQATAVVSSPTPLTEEKQEQIANQFAKITGRRIVVETVLKPELLGGIQVRIGDRLYDGSLSGKLARLEKSLK